MLNYLEQGMILYVMAAVSVIGVISRLISNHFYKNLIRQSENPSSAKDKQLQQMKTKYESIYRMNCGMKNTEVFVNKMQLQYKVAGIRLVNWENVFFFAAGAVFLVGAISSLMLFVNEESVQICITYLAGGGLMAAAVILLSGTIGVNVNRELLENNLLHYFDNVLVVRSARDMPEGILEEETDDTNTQERELVRASAAARARGTMRDDIFMQNKDASKKEDEEKRQNRPELVRKDDTTEKAHQKQLEELKESLAQIAAARTDNGDRQIHKQQTRKLSPKEEQLINDIINQYLS